MIDYRALPILVNIFISDFSEDPESLPIRFADFTKLKAFELTD